MGANKGYSIIELLIVIVIITIIAGMVMARIGDFGTSRAHQSDVQVLLSTLSQARSLVVSGQADRCGANDRVFQTYIMRRGARDYELGYQCQINFRTAPTLANPTMISQVTMSAQSQFDVATVRALAYFRSGTLAQAASGHDQAQLPDADGSLAVRINGPANTCTCVRVLQTGLQEQSTQCNFATAGLAACTY